MFLRLFLLFTLIPIIELYLILQVGHAIGALPTFAAILAAGILGAALVKHEGAAALKRVGATLAGGRMPADELIEALLIFAAGILLIAPGFLTDFIALFLLLPPTRILCRELVKRRIAKGLRRGTIRVQSFGRWPGNH